MKDQSKSLAEMFHAHALAKGSHAALVIGGVTISYTELSQKAQQLANWLHVQGVHKIGIFASRSLAAYIAVLAAQWAGIAYIPLNPAYPASRLKKMTEQADLQALILDEQRATLLLQDEFDFFAKFPVVALTCDLLGLPSHFNVITENDIQNSAQVLNEPLSLTGDELAYIIFTSGSTGEPKGVPVTFANLAAFAMAVKGRYVLTHADRVSQFSNLSFDVSLFDMVLAWRNGATLYVVPEDKLLAPGAFIRENALTVWLAVPAVIGIMSKLHLLKENIFPSLRYSLFTGEALLNELAMLWQRAAPLSQIENLYGPTEATIDCIGYVFHQDKVVDSYDIVPIGKPFQNIKAALVNELGEFVSAPDKGELVLSGDQVIEGYWQDTVITQQKFKMMADPEGNHQLWYFTGDCCHQDENGDFHYHYRLDGQRKVYGQRIELEEIEFYIRKFLQNNRVVVLLVTKEKKLDPQILAVIQGESIAIPALSQYLKKQLPDYMIPEKYVFVESFPYNANGKLDRHLLTQMMIESGEA